MVRRLSQLAAAATGHEVLMATLIDGTSPMVLDAAGYAYWPAWE